MDANVNEIGQMNFNLPHDVVMLPSKGKFYKSKKKSVKVGYLTANDENILANLNFSKSVKESIVLPLLRNKLYEPDLRPEELLDGDLEALLIFLRNTSFGPEYLIEVIDPKTEKPFSTTILLDELNIVQAPNEPNEEGLFTTTLPRSGADVKLKLLNLKEQMELDELIANYPAGRMAPSATLRLQKNIVELNGSRDGGEIAKFIEQMPIMDSKHIKKVLNDNEPRLDLSKIVIAPSGEKVNVSIAFGVEFFRPFF
jgi:hypothetical protein